ncbi:DEAD/DEAH box helicase [Cetobacterium sp. SF1]|uniref:DEAD/DEAH box helicase n=1 Tax=Cetobacterium sp. SF1 TaxID=3417654 RepID=UPI003CF262BA
MSINFSKFIKPNITEKVIDPIKLYNELDRKSIAGPLRPTQEYILKEWFKERRYDKDLIVKLDTGAGKTLIGLLMLLSKLNETKEPCLYICPDKYLVDQVCTEAKKFGIAYCTIDENKSNIPLDFINSKKILITNAQKVFNGLSKFGIRNNYKEVGTLILDDSHATIDVIRQAFTITITKVQNKILYNKLFILFEEDLKEVEEGTVLNIQNGDYGAFVNVPYWSWKSKSSLVLSILNENKASNEIKYSYQLLMNNLDKCKMLISSDKIEISPYYLPIEEFGSFANAKNRILLSATTQNDSFFINSLGFKINAIKNPLINSEIKWSGEKMILIPSLINDNFKKEELIKLLSSPKEDRSSGIVGLVPSNKKAEIYKKHGAKVATMSTLSDSIIEMKEKKNFKETLVICNKYDGIDLPDETCRTLIIDSLPYFDTLSDRYEKNCRVNSEIINKKLAQKIEQGLGRNIRGEKDYGAVILLGGDLVRFIQDNKMKKYFSPQTQKQIEIGINLAEIMEKDGTDIKEQIKSLVNQLIIRDEGWKQYYSQQMNEINVINQNNNVHTALEAEYLAEKSYYHSDYEKAKEIIQAVIDSETDEHEKGWFLQNKARYENMINQNEAMKLQKIAYSKNHYLLKPKDGIVYKKMNGIDLNRTRKIKNWLNNYKTYSELVAELDGIFEDLCFEVEAEKFEDALKDIGILLGFESQRPDKEFKVGPDNLWYLGDNNYIMFECKSQVKSERECIKKTEAGQMSSHIGWFNEQYPNSSIMGILVIPTNKLANDANFVGNIKIMRAPELKKLKTKIKEFIKSFSQYKFESLTEDDINRALSIYKLDIKSLKDNYVANYK